MNCRTLSTGIYDAMAEHSGCLSVTRMCLEGHAHGGPKQQIPRCARNDIRFEWRGALTRHDVASTLDALRLRAAKGAGMAKLALVYGLRLFPSEELGEIADATITLKDGRSARVTMHLIEGSKEEIEATLRQSVEAFFDMYPEI
jgi:hypothetical protein